MSEHGPNPNYESAEPGTAYYRIVKLQALLGQLTEQFKTYKELQAAPYTKDQWAELEKVRTEIASQFSQMNRLLQKMGDFPFVEEDLELVVNLVDHVDQLSRDWYNAIRPNETHIQKSNIEQFFANLDERLNAISGHLHQLPSDKRLPLQFESGHYDQLLQDVNRGDIEKILSGILELDRLLTDDYTISPKTLLGGATLRFRIEQALKKPSDPHSTNLKAIALSKGILCIKTTQAGVDIWLERLDEEQKRLWEKIK